MGFFSRQCIMRFVYILRIIYLTFKLASWLKSVCGSLAHSFTVVNFKFCSIHLERSPPLEFCKNNLQKKPISKASPSRKGAHLEIKPSRKEARLEKKPVSKASPSRKQAHFEKKPISKRSPSRKESHLEKKPTKVLKREEAHELLFEVLRC